MRILFFHPRFINNKTYQMCEKIEQYDLHQTKTTEREENPITIYSIVENEEKSPQSNSKIMNEQPEEIKENYQKHGFKNGFGKLKNSSVPSKIQDVEDLTENKEIVEGMIKGEDDQKLPVFNPEESFESLKQAYLNSYKALFIIEEILDQIEAENLLDYSEESHVQFLFLVWTRARNYLKTAIKLTKPFSINHNSKCELSNLDAYDFKASTKFKIYNQMLDEIRNKLGQKIGRLFHFKKSVSGKQKFLDGFEQLDYTVAEQIQFTYSHYIQIVLNTKEIKSQYFINHRFKKVLKGYRKICLLTSQKINQPKDILVKFNEIVTDQ